MMGETIKDAVAAYRAGEMTLEELAANIAGRTWPPLPPKPQDIDERMAAAEDIDYFAPGTWNGDVMMLEINGQLSEAEYDVISEAADKAAGR